VFASAYLVVRVLHVALFAAGSDDVNVHQAARALAPTAVLAPLLVVGAGAFDGAAQIGLWVGALALDYVGGGLRGIEGWRLSPGHFAERHGLIVIIALGESIVAIGVGASGIELTAKVVLGATLGIALVASLWWTYFDGTTERVAQRLRLLQARRRNTTARDAYSFLHLPMVAGIVLLALGVKKTLGHVDEPLALVPAIGLCGGTALYLAAQVAFRLRTTGSGSPSRLLTAACCAALIPLATSASALVALGTLAAVCAALVAYVAEPA
jgi:low temperature requirement protein LtrA